VRRFRNVAGCRSLAAGGIHDQKPAKEFVENLPGSFAGGRGDRALGSDQQKAEKRVRQISAMAVDSRTRAIVNQTMADEFHAKRIELMRQRHAMNMSYGSLFIAHELTATGCPCSILRWSLRVEKI